MDIGQIANKVFALLKGNGMKIKIFDEVGSETVDPTMGRRFFVNIPNLMVNIDPELGIEFIKGSGIGEEVNSIQNAIKGLADKNLMNCTIKIIGKTIEPKDYSYQAKVAQGKIMNENTIKPVNSFLLGKVMRVLGTDQGTSLNDIAAKVGGDPAEVQTVLNKLVKDGKVTSTGVTPDGQHLYQRSMEEAVFESLKEGFSRMYGTVKTSKQELDEVKIVVKHRLPVNEEKRGARSKEISEIYIESAGVRTKLPTTNIQGARAMARHIACGGSIDGAVGTYIIESANSILKLRQFESYARSNRLVNEETKDVMDSIGFGINKLRSDLKALSGVTGYQEVSERIMVAQDAMIDESDLTHLREKFTVKFFDESVGESLPLVSRLVFERQQYIKDMMEAASSTIKLSSLPITSPIMEFTSENSELGYKLSEFASRIQENEKLAKYIRNVSESISKGYALSEFDKNLISNALVNATISEVADNDVNSEIDELSEYEKFLESFDIKFI